MFDLRPSWPLFVDSSMELILLACGSFGAGISSLLKRTLAPQRCFPLVGMICSFNAGLAGVGYLMLQLPRDCFYPLLRAALYLLGSIALYSPQPFCFVILIVLALVAVIGRFIQDCVIYSDCSYLSDAPPALPIAFASIAAAILLLRRLALRQVLRSVAMDQAAYDARWSDLISDPTEREALHRLKAAVDRLEPRPRRAAARQLSRSRAKPGVRRESWVPSPPLDGAVAESDVPGRDEVIDSGDTTVAGRADEERPVQSLDQLYAQAAVATALLQQKAAEWAAATRGRPLEAAAAAAAAAEGAAPGLFLGRVACGGPPELLLPPTACAMVRQRALKPPTRAVSKAAACYGGDVSRLLDLARARLVFGAAADLAECVQLVCCGDADVRVVRVRSSLHERHEPAETAGFRVSAARSASGNPSRAWHGNPYSRRNPGIRDSDPRRNPGIRD